MKLICPRCGAKNKITTESRFLEFECEACEYLYTGLEAKVAPMDFVMGMFFSMSQEYRYPGKTPCPHCCRPIRLEDDPEHGGYIGPDVCPSCGRDLPTKDECIEERRAEATARIAPVPAPARTPSPPAPPKPNYPPGYKPDPSMEAAMALYNNTRKNHPAG